MEKTYTEEQIRAAMGPVLNCNDVEERIIAALPARKLRSDIPVMYKDPNGTTYMSRYSEGFSIKSGEATNICALIPEDEMMGWIDDYRVYGLDNKGYAESPGQFVQRKLDAYKYGEET